MEMSKNPTETNKLHVTKEISSTSRTVATADQYCHARKIRIAAWPTVAAIFQDSQPYLLALLVNLVLACGLTMYPFIVNRTVTMVVIIVTTAVTSRIITVWYI